MRKPMIKIYAVLAVSLALCLLITPSVLGHTSAWSSGAAIRLKLLINKNASAASAVEDTARIVFIMDDGWETQYTQGYAILEKYDYPGCIAVIPAAVNTDGYMNYSELADLYIDGWDMLNHTNNHETLTGLTGDEQKDQLVKAREWLQSHGLRRGSDIVVFPGGGFDQATLQALKEEGFSAGRSLKSLWAVYTGCSLEDAEVCNLLPGLNMDYVKAAVDKAIHNHSTLLFVIHKLEPVSDDQHMQLPPEEFSRIVEYVHDHDSELSVVTLSQILNYL